MHDHPKLNKAGAAVDALSTTFQVAAQCIILSIPLNDSLAFSIWSAWLQNDFEEMYNTSTMSLWSDALLNMRNSILHGFTSNSIIFIPA